VPLASGLLSGKITSDTKFEKDDHRNFNREGKAFDKGETFSGVPLEKAFPAIEELKEQFAGNHDLAAQAIRWILMFEQLGTVIPGASTMDQVGKNIIASDLPPLTLTQMLEARRVYAKYIKEEVHHLW
jgi:aryl-alcohol dehydrogenase-like predicted oxidoreductase